MGILQRIYSFFTTASYKRTRGVLIVLTMAIAIPFTVFVAGQEQDIRQYASERKIKKIPVPTQPVLPAFKKAIRFSSEFMIPTSTQKLSGSKPSTLVRSEAWTIEGFVRVSQSLSGTPKKGKMNLLSLTQNKTATLKENIASLYIDVEENGTFKPYAAVLTKTNSQIIIGGKNNIYLKPDRWYHLAGEFEYLYDTKQCYYSLWIDGMLVEGKLYDIDACPIRLPDPQSVVIGGEIPFPLPTITPLPNITLDVDEVRVSQGVPRYIYYFLSGLNFSRPTEPFVADPYTALLWHFDDNFKDEGYYGYDLNFLSGVVNFIDANIPQIGIPETKKPQNCAQVLTPARNPKTNECRVFRNSCIPDGWVRVASCTSQ